MAPTLTTSDPPLVLETDVVAIAIAVKDTANSTGDIIRAGDVALTLKESEDLSGNFSLLVCMIYNIFYIHECRVRSSVQKSAQRLNWCVSKNLKT